MDIACSKLARRLSLQAAAIVVAALLLAGIGAAQIAHADESDTYTSAKMVYRNTYLGGSGALWNVASGPKTITPPNAANDYTATYEYFVTYTKLDYPGYTTTAVQPNFLFMYNIFSTTSSTPSGDPDHNFGTGLSFDGGMGAFLMPDIVTDTFGTNYDTAGLTTAITMESDDGVVLERATSAELGLPLVDSLGVPADTYGPVAAANIPKVVNTPNTEVPYFTLDFTKQDVYVVKVTVRQQVPAAIVDAGQFSVGYVYNSRSRTSFSQDIDFSILNPRDQAVYRGEEALFASDVSAVWQDGSEFDKAEYVGQFQYSLDEGATWTDVGNPDDLTLSVEGVPDLNGALYRYAVYVGYLDDTVFSAAARLTVLSHAVYFDANTADQVENMPSPLSNLVPGDSVVQPDATPSRIGYRFEGWNTSPVGTGQSFAAALAQGMPDSDLTFYAQWVPGDPDAAGTAGSATTGKASLFRGPASSVANTGDSPLALLPIMGVAIACAAFLTRAWVIRRK